MLSYRLEKVENMILYTVYTVLYIAVVIEIKSFLSFHLLQTSRK